MRRTVLPFIVLGLLGACATGPQPQAKLTPRQEKELARALDGKVAGEPVSCVSSISANDSLRALSDDVLLLRVNKNLVYRNDLRGSCNGLSRGDILVMIRWGGSQYCQGDMGYAVNPFSSIPSGSCSLGKFVPYRTPGKKG